MKTIPQKLQEQAKKRPYSPAYYVKEGSSWKSTDWKTFTDEVRAAGRALITLGVESGGTVAILGFNRPEWAIIDHATMAIGGAPAGVYTTCSAEEVQYIVDHAESSVVVIEDKGQWAKIQAQRENMPKLKHVVTMKGCETIDDDMVLSWEQFMAKASETDESVFDERLAKLDMAALATLIYTSGTTGPPKGVMLSHENLSWTANLAATLVGGTDADCSLSYLPLSHIAEQMFTIHVPATTGAATYYAESIEKVADNLKEVQPTVFFGVPRIWEKFYAGVTGKLSQAEGFKKSLVDWTRRVCARVNGAKNRGEAPSVGDRVQYYLADRILLSKLKPAIGLGNARFCVSGAAPIASEILEFFSSLDINVCEVYGQSEGSGPTTFNLPGATLFGTVGRALPGVDVKIAEDGEIVFKGPNVFMGYLKEEKATQECLIDGWLHSGDLGAFDRDGFLSITGRKKDIIITAGGKNVAPKNIEAALKNTRLVNEAVVIGDRRKYLTALVTVDEEAFADFVSEKNLNGEKPHESDAVRGEIQSSLDQINSTLAKVETIKKFSILPRNLTVENGELTPTLKVKRSIVNEHFSNEIEAMYAD